MSLAVAPPLIRSSSSKRDSARLDVLTMMMKSDGPKRKPSPGPSKLNADDTDNKSPRDSLSPFDDQARNELGFLGRSDGRQAVDLTRDDTHEKQSPLPSGEIGSTFRQQPSTASHPPRQVAPTQQGHASPFPVPPTPHEEAMHTPTTSAACPPRSSSLQARHHQDRTLPRPTTRGSSTTPSHGLNPPPPSRPTESRATRTPAPRSAPPLRPQRPLRPSASADSMGNKPSSLSGSPEPDSSSLRSQSRNPIRVLRKSSTNLLSGGRHQSKSPFQPELSTVIHLQQPQISPVPAPAPAPKRPATSHATTSRSLSRAQQDGLRSTGPPPPLSTETTAVNSASSTTMNDGLAGMRPLSASTAVQDSRNNSRRGSRIENMGFLPQDNQRDSEQEDDNDDEQESSSPLPAVLPLSQLRRDAALSPSLPAPSPLPEDSPHKYGLKDRMTTPEMPEPQEINVAKARRRSSGIEIFNEAKSLQSASSFLNGLSTSRRRAESAQRSRDTTDTWQTVSANTARPPSTSTRPASSHYPQHHQPHAQPRPTPSLPQITLTPSTRPPTHAFKPSSFAYAPALKLPQLSCAREHNVLHRSPNALAPVECAICHTDDEGAHWSCSWCAVRMCGFCRGAFGKGRLRALRERIRLAEMGGREEESGGEEEGRWGNGRKGGHGRT